MVTITRIADTSSERGIEVLLARFLHERFGIRGNPRAIIPYLHRQGLPPLTARVPYL